MSLIIARSGLVEDLLIPYRKAGTGLFECYRSAKAASVALAHEMAESLEYRVAEFDTLTRRVSSRSLTKNILLVPKVRSGLAMLDPFIETLRVSNTAFATVVRDGTQKVRLRTPEGTLRSSAVIILDPIIGTGSTIVTIADFLASQGFDPGIIHVGSLMCTELGAEAILEKHPDIKLCVGVLTDALDSSAGVQPRVGDFGDRVYGVARD